MSDSKLQPTHDIMWKSRTYTDKDGKEKGVWLKVGTLFSTPHMSNISIKIDAMPVSKEFDGFLAVFERKERQETPQGGGKDVDL